MGLYAWVDRDDSTTSSSGFNAIDDKHDLNIDVCFDEAPQLTDSHTGVDEYCIDKWIISTAEQFGNFQVGEGWDFLLLGLAWNANGFVSYADVRAYQRYVRWGWQSRAMTACEIPPAPPGNDYLFLMVSCKKMFIPSRQALSL